MGLEEFFEGELSAEGVVEEVAVYLLILGVLIVAILTPIYNIVKRFNKKLPWEQFLVKRFFLEVGIVLLISGGLGFLFGNLIHHFIEHDLPTLMVITRTILFLFIITSLLIGIVEFLLVSEDRDRLKSLSERLEKEKVISLYNALKNQVNPHFLFNHLSVLSSLIYHDVKKADQFIIAFSNIYRYVLELKEAALVTVQEEMDFLQSWLYLQKIRFGKNLQIDKQVADSILQGQIPPLSLQTVFENAIKHNVVSKAKPLNIQVIQEGNILKIINNYQPRVGDTISTGIGLKNLKERYLLISDLAPTFEIKNKQYIACLPILSSI